MALSDSQLMSGDKKEFDRAEHHALAVMTNIEAKVVINLEKGFRFQLHYFPKNSTQPDSVLHCTPGPA